MNKIFDIALDGEELIFLYTNWKGEKGVRRVKPLEIFLG